MAEKTISYSNLSRFWANIKTKLENKVNGAYTLTVTDASPSTDNKTVITLVSDGSEAEDTASLGRVGSATLTISANDTVHTQSLTSSTWWWAESLTVESSAWASNCSKIRLTVNNDNSTSAPSELTDFTWFCDLVALKGTTDKIYKAEMCDQMDTTNVYVSNIEIYAYNITSTSATVNVVFWKHWDLS